MFIPIGDQNIKDRGRPIVNYTLISINIIVFFLIEFPMFDSPVQLERLFVAWGAQPCEILRFVHLHTLVSSMFLHGGLAHLFGNMFFLYVFGDNIELTVGRWNYLGFYLLGGIAAVYSHAVLEGLQMCTPMVGASGAIAAVMGCYLVLYPLSRVRILAFIFFSFYIPAWVFLALWGGQEIFTSLRGISLINEVGDQVAHAAHAGGFIVGLLAGFYYRSRFSMRRLR